MKRFAIAGFIIWAAATIALRLGGQFIFRDTGSATAILLLIISLPLMIAVAIAVCAMPSGARSPQSHSSRRECFSTRSARSGSREYSRTFVLMPPAFSAAGCSSATLLCCWRRWVTRLEARGSGEFPVDSLRS